MSEVFAKGCVRRRERRNQGTKARVNKTHCLALSWVFAINAGISWFPPHDMVLNLIDIGVVIIITQRWVLLHQN